MTIKTSLLVLAFTYALVCFSSCRKDGQSSIVEHDFKEERVKTLQWSGGGISSYTYDSEKRQIKEVQNTGITTVFIYQPGKITRVVTQGTTSDNFTYTLNAEGYINTLLTPDGTTYTYEYTPDGMIARQYSNEANPYIATHYYSSATGLTDSIRQTIGGVWYSTAFYTYYMDKRNSLKNENLGLSVYGEEFLRPIKRYRSLFRNGNTIQEQITDFTYTYDSKQRITSKTFVSGGQNLTYTYTYY